MKNQKAKSFTLVEFLVVIAIIAIATGIFFSVFRALQPSLRLGSVARDLATDLRSAQQSAVTEQLNFGVYFSTTTEEYEIKKYGTETKTVLVKSFPQGVEYKEVTGFSQSEAIFNPYGAVQEMGSVSLTNIKGEIKTIEVRPSGFVKIK